MKKIAEKQELKSNWKSVATLIGKVNEIKLGNYASYWMYKSPRRMLHAMAYYKFASKMIGSRKRVLDVGCNEGLGSWLLAKECGYCLGMDFDEEAIICAKNNFNDETIDFICSDFLAAAPSEWDAVVNFDVIEHILPDNAPLFFEKMAMNLNQHGIAIVGTPSKISQEFASAVSKQGHVNIYSYERLEKEMRRHFTYVFLFSAHDEVVHTGFFPLAHYFIALGCSKL